MLGHACFGSWIVWLWLALVAQLSASILSCVEKRKALEDK